jgi:D-sedoheptulose 7-phosphate isomerase
MLSFANKYFEELRRISAAINLEAASAAGEALVQVWREGGRIYVAGNGGSASTASHLVCDLAKLTITQDMPRLRATSLCDNVPLLTAWSNDSSYADVFVQQVRDVLKPEDVVICISGSGNSENVVRLASYARSQNVQTIGLLGFSGGRIGQIVHLPIIIPSTNMQIIEDLHLATCHMLSSVLRVAIGHYAESGSMVATAEDFMP